MSRQPTSDRSPRRHRLVPGVDGLEGRELLSYGGGTAHVMPLAGGSGIVHKHPAFYEFYTGPKRADLDVVAASGRLNGGTLTLSGMMQGKIVKAPKTPGDESFYVFGIDRGSPQAIAPFFNRPGVVFDSVVVVSVKTTGVTASVVDFTSGQSTNLSPKSVHISGKTVSVTVPASLLPAPPGGADLAHASFNLWPRNSLDMTPQPNHGSTVASFIPEDAMAPIASAHHR